MQQVRAGEYRHTRVDVNYMFELPRREDVPALMRAGEYNFHRVCAQPAEIPDWAFDLDLVHPSARAAS
ncbi:hypothetical protein [Parahaliea mediterranea]|uniref:hypothetical protein n=1 Tax=Parahaliea mediterranea TaxID=651086 RepID=UPI003D67BAC7